ncbi:MAG: hypothetical protein KME11_04675 [Timaviella obliquedivisa GSE-PSE-MK23-08B]|jgi:rhodanese-related sulfurtransferase|nr:hypothetical protein [Timaviella obliquedivisa GSE-PSE-MK23-08B]
MSDQLLAQVLITLKNIEARLDQIESPHFREDLTGWLRPYEAWAALKTEGVRSQQHLKKLRLAGAFSEIKGEIRNVGLSDRPVWEYNVEGCRKALAKYFKKLDAARQSISSSS